MRTDLIFVAVLFALVGASPAALSQRTSTGTEDAVAFTGNTMNTHHDHYRYLTKRVDFRGNCDLAQWDRIHDAMYVCNQVARRAAEVTRTNHTKLKEFFPYVHPDSIFWGNSTCQTADTNKANC